MDKALSYLSIARDYMASGEWQSAFCMYTCAFLRDPRLKQNYELEFRLTHLQMNEKFAAEGHKIPIIKNFQRAIKLFPNNISLLNDLASYLYKYRYYSESMCYFQKALSLDNSAVTVEKNLNKVKSVIFPRKLFKLMNDNIKNDAYRESIRSIVTDSIDTVIDIDMGIGMLALDAKQCNPTAVTISEVLPYLKPLAECIMNTTQNKDIVVLKKTTTNLNRLDICGVNTVIVTDKFDSGLLGEYILGQLSHAWENLLDKNSRIIPGKAEYFVCGVKCDELNMKYKLNKKAKDLLNIDMNVHTTNYDDSYSSEDLHSYKDIKYITEPVSLFKIDFNSCIDVNEKLYREKPYIAELVAQEDGDMNLIVGWFDLHLTDNITISTNPTVKDKVNGWEQAVFFDVLPKKLRKDDIVTAPFQSYRGKLSLIPEDITRVSPATIAFLNDDEYINMIVKSIGTVCVYLGQTTEICHVDIVDLSPFPLFGLLLIKRGANSLTCHAKTIDDKIFIQTVLKANNIPKEKVTVLIGDFTAYRAFKNRKFHVMFCNVIDFNGDVDIGKKKIIREFKIHNLKDGGLCLPAKVTMIGQLINSNDLELKNRLFNENKMATHVNKFQVTRVLNVDISMLKYEVLSDEFEIDINSSASGTIKVSNTQDGECTAIICYYKVQLIDSWYELYTNRSNSFAKSMAFIASDNVNICNDNEVNVLRCVDNDGSFKLVLDVK